jgi:hypothetical protein
MWALLWRRRRGSSPAFLSFPKVDICEKDMGMIGNEMKIP